MAKKLTDEQMAFLKRHQPRSTLNRFEAEAETPFLEKMLATGLIGVVETKRLAWFDTNGEPLPLADRQWAGTKLTDKGEAFLLSEGHVWA